jgi:hypothetical protein
MTTTLLRHKPGLLSRHPNLGSIMNEDSDIDPLQGNYTLIEECGIITAFQGLKDKVTVNAHSTNAGTLELKARMQIGDEQSDKVTRLASADFNSDSKSEIALAYAQGGKLYLYMGTYTEGDPSVLQFGNLIISFNDVNDQSIQISSGFSDDNQSQVILSWCDLAQNLHLWIATFNENLSIKNYAELTGPKISDGKTFEIQSGIFTGTTNSELVVFYYGPSDVNGNTLFLGLYKYKENKINFISKTPVGIFNSSQPFISLTAGAFLVSTIKDGIAVAWTSDKEALLETYLMGERDNTFDRIYSGPLPKGDNKIPVRLAVGDLNMDGVEELLVGIATSSNTLNSYLHLMLYNFTNTLIPQLKSQAYVYGNDSFKYIAHDFSLSIGPLENKTGVKIIIAALGSENNLTPLQGYSLFSLGLMEVLNLEFPNTYWPNPGQLTQLYSSNEAFDSSKPIKLNIALNLGNFNGKSTRVGKPRYTLVSECVNVVAIINMVPTQYEFDNEGEVTFEKSDGQTTSLGLITNRNYVTSDFLNGSIGLDGIVSIDKSITNTYGENFIKAFESFSEITESLTVLTTEEDYIIFISNDFQTWEYPVYDETGETSIGNILLVFPTTNAKRIKIVPSLSYDANYRPRHILGNILSYSPSIPADYNPSSGSFCNNIIVTGSGMVTVEASWTNKNKDTLSNEITQDQTIGKNVGFKGTLDFLAGASLGIDYGFQESYTQSETSTYDVEFMSTTVISLDVDPFSDRDKTYEIIPYVYWTEPGNYLKLDYTVAIPASSNYYFEHYSTPEATFHLPWWDTGDREYYSRDLNIIDNGDNTITVEVTVHNDTLGTVDITRISIYNGNPLEGGEFLAEGMIPSIAQRGLEMVILKNVLTTVPGQAYLIYARIDDSEKIAFGIYEAS